MFGLTLLGIIHTLISLLALGVGVYALRRSGEIAAAQPDGRWYLLLTLATAVTALGIFTRGVFGPGHVLAVLTLVALAVGTLAERGMIGGRWARPLQIVAYSATFLFHLIPGVTETSTRLPPGAPLVASPESPALLPVFGLLLLLYVAGVTWQLRRLRASRIAA